jgi:hypothetical protein
VSLESIVSSICSSFTRETIFGSKIVIVIKKSLQIYYRFLCFLIFIKVDSYVRSTSYIGLVTAYGFECICMAVLSLIGFVY